MSGCRAEESKLRSAERLANLIAILCILAWRVLWMCLDNRTSPDLPARLVFTDTDIKLLETLVPPDGASRKKTIGCHVVRLAKPGFCLDQTQDSPPGYIVLWRGMTRLTDIHLGFCLARDVGNRKIQGTDTPRLVPGPRRRRMDGPRRQGPHEALCPDHRGPLRPGDRRRKKRRTHGAKSGAASSGQEWQRVAR